MQIIEYLDKKISQHKELIVRAEETIRTAEFEDCAPLQLVERLKQVGFVFPSEEDEEEARSQRRASEDELETLINLRKEYQEVKVATATGEE